MIYSHIVISAVLAILLSLATYKFGLLTKDGCISSAIIGFGIGALGGVWWLLLLILFTLMGFAATLIGFSKKKSMGVQEGNHGERGYKNVIGVSLPALAMAVLNFIFPGNDVIFAIAYIATISVAAADTAASELGVRDPRVWMITTLKRVEPGVDGGISLKGTEASLAAAIVVSLLGYLMIFQTLDYFIIIPIICGFLGCMADSVVGATIETKGYVSKYTNNCLTGLFGGLLAIAFLMI